MISVHIDAATVDAWSRFLSKMNAVYAAEFSRTVTSDAVIGAADSTAETAWFPTFRQGIQRG